MTDRLLPLFKDVVLEIQVQWGLHTRASKPVKLENWGRRTFEVQRGAALHPGYSSLPTPENDL